MNHHQRHLPPGVNRALRSLSLLLLTLASQRAFAAWPRLHKPTPDVGINARGYLSAVGAPGLRFQEPTAVLSAHLPAASPTAAPPRTIGEEKAEITPQPPTPSVASTTTGDESNDAGTRAEKSPAKAKTSPHIIPDDTHRSVHPEDFLPFFQFPAPAQNGNLNVIVPVPREPSSAAPLPASSATYTQTPK